jgi:hypothetical protein
MTRTHGIVDAQTRSLLELLSRTQVERSSRWLDAAHRRAKEIRGRAHRRAREVVSSSIRQERADLAQELRRLEAIVETREQEARLRQAKSLLSAARPLLRTALARRWADPDQRSEWVAAALAEASRVLPSGRWRLRYPAGQTWNPQDERALPDAPGDTELVPEADAELEMGVIIESGQTRLDASAAGLLARPDWVAGALLAELDRSCDSEETM